MDKIDEAAKRRPEFKPGTPVVLGDGQSWQLRRPVLWFAFPHDGAPAGFRSCLELEPGDDFQAMMDELAGLFRPSEAGDEERRGAGAQVIGLELRIASRMLLANYDLTPEELSRLLRFGYDKDANPEGRRIRDECMDVAEGLGPKPSPDGTDASPMPSGDFPGETG